MENIRLGPVLTDREPVPTASCSPISPFLRFVVTEPSRMKSVRTEGCHVGLFREFVGTACCTYGQSNTTINTLASQRSKRLGQRVRPARNKENARVWKRNNTNQQHGETVWRNHKQRNQQGGKITKAQAGRLKEKPTTGHLLILKELLKDA